MKTERIYDLVMLCRALHAKIRNVEVTEDCESRPHKPVRFEVSCRKEPQYTRILKPPSDSEERMWRKGSTKKDSVPKKPEVRRGQSRMVA